MMKLFIIIIRTLFFVLTCLAVIAAGAYLAFLAYQTVFDIPDVSVPSVINMELAMAQETLHKEGLKILVMNEEIFRDGDLFFVISQKPPTGTEIKKNRFIEVEIRSKRDAYQIPDLIGKTLQEAKMLLEEKRFGIGNIAYSMHHIMEQGRIIAQTPRPGENIQTNGLINLLVSKGIY